MNFFTELKRRNVVRVGVAYVVLGWVMVQATDTVTPALHLPDWTLGFVIWIGVIGFPFALLFAWAFELTPEGIKLERDVDRSDSTTHVTGRTLDFLIIGMLILALGFVAVDQYVLEESVTAVEDVASPPLPAAVPAIVEETAKSIAVLPFVNMSEDNDYFADGLTEEILNLLARNVELRVTARTSSFAFKGRNQDLREIGSVLGVTSLLEGSVRRSGKRLRVTAQLINVEDGFHIWSETYDREMTDVFELQDDIAGAIFSALEIHLGQSKPQRGQPTTNMAAYEKFLQGRALLSGIEKPKGRELLLEAVALDPNFAEAWQQLALANWFQGGGVLSTEEGRLQTLEAANRALALNPNLLLAAAMQASSDPKDWTWLREIEGLEAALGANPDDSNILSALVFDLQEAGYFEEALSLSEQAVLIDPLSVFNHSQLGLSLLAVDRKEEARTAFQKAINMGGARFGVWAFVELMVSGNQEQAIATLESTYSALELDASTIRQRVLAATNPATQLETVEAWSQEATRLDNGPIADWWLYLAFGLQDELFEKLLAALPVDSIWSDSDQAIWASVAFRDSGFTAHPRFVELSRENGTIELWEERGPPDFCRKRAGQWRCL